MSLLNEKEGAEMLPYSFLKCKILKPISMSPKTESDIKRTKNKWYRRQYPVDASSRMNKKLKKKRVEGRRTCI